MHASGRALRGHARPDGRADGRTGGQGYGRTRAFYYTSQQNTRPNEKSWLFPHGFGFFVKRSENPQHELKSDYF